MRKSRCEDPEVQAIIEVGTQSMEGVAHGGPILVMQDPVFFSYGKHVKTRGLGLVGQPTSLESAASSKSRASSAGRAPPYRTHGVRGTR